MKVSITTQQELVKPKLEVYINLENGESFFILKSTCQACAGYGCNTHRHNNDQCNSGDICTQLKPEDSAQNLGC